MEMADETFRPERSAARKTLSKQGHATTQTNLPEQGGNGFASAQATHPEYSWALRSHPGVIRLENEDFVGAYSPSEPEECGPFFAVADGMGGHAAGEVASRLAVESALEGWTSGSGGSPHQVLRSAMRSANSSVFAASLDHGRQGMGTTLTALALAGREAFVAHVGDSRAYLVRNGRCSQLTSDHSRVAEMLRMRLITPEQAAVHPARSQLTRSLGANPAIQVDVAREKAEKDDVFVLCSDGLWDLVSRTDIAKAVAAPVEEAAGSLLKMALERGAPDNVTVVVVRIASDHQEPFATGPKPWWLLLRRERGRREREGRSGRRQA